MRMKRLAVAIGVLALTALSYTSRSAELRAQTIDRSVEGSQPVPVCEAVDMSATRKPRSEPVMPLGPDDLPAGTRSWEAIPSVIRDDGVDTFLLEVDTNGPVNRVIVTNLE